MLLTSAMQVVQWQRGRNFEGVLSLTRDNKVHYANLHGYDYIDASWIVSGAPKLSNKKVFTRYVFPFDDSIDVYWDPS